MRSIVLLIGLLALAQCGDQDLTKDFQEICSENGFLFETHEVVTADGYINTIFRIPGKIGEATTSKPPVYFQHGILDSADAWIMNEPDVAPAFFLANQGYDIWLGNSRGNKYSMSHTTLTTKDADYWKFSFQQMGDYDDPANLEYIKAETGFDKAAYIAHSQGTTQMFYALSHNESYFAEHVSVFFALGPVLRLSNCKSDLISFFAAFDWLIEDVCELFGIYDMFPANWIDDTATQILCGYIPELCDFGVYLICDEDTDLDNTVRLEDYTGGHFPSGTGLYTLVHYAQILNSGQFQQYDFGKHKNEDVYGQSSPPIIDISNIKGDVPICMFVGAEDELADTTDAEWARDQMGDAVKFYHEYQLGHLSFLVAKETSWFTIDLYNLLQQYWPSTTTKTQANF